MHYQQGQEHAQSQCMVPFAVVAPSACQNLNDIQLLHCNDQMLVSFSRELRKSYIIPKLFTRHHTKIVWFSSLPKKRIAWYKCFFIRKKSLHEKERGKSYTPCIINILSPVPCSAYLAYFGTQAMGNHTLSVAGLFCITFLLHYTWQKFLMFQWKKSCYVTFIIVLQKISWFKKLKAWKHLEFNTKLTR